MKTVVFKTYDLEGVRRYANEHLSQPAIQQVDRLISVQSADLDYYSDESLWDIARAFGLPLLAIVDKPPFDSSVPAPVVASPWMLSFPSEGGE